MTPTQRTLAWLRENGYAACVVERFIAPRKIRIDAFGFADILAYGKDPLFPGNVPTHGTMLVQCTTSSNLAAHRTKMQENGHVKGWISAGGHVLLFGWSKRGPRGKRKTWQPTIETL